MFLYAKNSAVVPRTAVFLQLLKNKFFITQTVKGPYFLGNNCFFDRSFSSQVNKSDEKSQVSQLTEQQQEEARLVRVARAKETAIKVAQHLADVDDLKHKEQIDQIAPLFKQSAEIARIRDHNKVMVKKAPQEIARATLGFKKEMDIFLEQDLTRVTKGIAKKKRNEIKNKYMDRMGWEYQSWPGDKQTVISLTRSEMGYKITLRFDYMLGFDNDDQTQDFSVHIYSMINQDSTTKMKQNSPLKTIDHMGAQVIGDGLVRKASQIALGCYIGQEKEFCIETLHFLEPNSPAIDDTVSPSDPSLLPKYSTYPLDWDELSDDVHDALVTFLDGLHIDKRLGNFVRKLSGEGRLTQHETHLKCLQQFSRIPTWREVH